MTWSQECAYLRPRIDELRCLACRLGKEMNAPRLTANSTQNINCVHSCDPLGV
jgi:hypothetical protein